MNEGLCGGEGDSVSMEYMVVMVNMDGMIDFYLFFSVFVLFT